MYKYLFEFNVFLTHEMQYKYNTIYKIYICMYKYVYVRTYLGMLYINLRDTHYYIIRIKQKVYCYLITELY